MDFKKPLEGEGPVIAACLAAVIGFGAFGKLHRDLPRSTESTGYIAYHPDVVNPLTADDRVNQRLHEIAGSINDACEENAPQQALDALVDQKREAMKGCLGRIVFRCRDREVVILAPTDGPIECASR